MSEFMIGVTAGLVTSLIVFVGQHLYLTLIKPWVENLVYKDARIEGRWRITYPDLQEEVEELATLKREAHKIKGQISCSKGPDVGKIYDVEGTFRNLLLTLTYTAQDTSALDRGSFVLLLNGNGASFSGRSCFYFDDENLIAEAKCEWRRMNG